MNNTRNIKFRAWDNKEKKWLLGYELPNLGGFSMFGEVMLMGEWSGLLSGRFPDELKTIEVDEWTGLKDADGKDVYENDYLYDGDTEPCLHRVFWNEDYAAFQVEVWNGGDEWVDHEYVWDELREVLKDLHVVGNVRENPELLENDTKSPEELP